MPIARFYGGREFYLVTYFKIRDMRVVYVPARSIGAYGGEVDNWMWPRHSGDFSFLRAYVGKDGRPAGWAKDNVPYRPLHYLPLAKAGLRAGDFTLILGYPGTSKRWSTAAEIDTQVQTDYPERIALLAQYIELLEKISTENETVKIKNAGVLKGLYNSIKNNRGLLAGLQKNRVHQRKLDREKDLAAFIAATPARQKKFAGLLGDIERLNGEEREILMLGTIYGWMNRGSRLLNWALTLNKWSHEKTKKDPQPRARFHGTGHGRQKRTVAGQPEKPRPGHRQGSFGFFPGSAPGRRQRGHLQGSGQGDPAGCREGAR